MIISIDFDNYFCIFTNLLCIIPSILFFLDNNIYDGIYTLSTGTVSFLYHINNNDPPILNQTILNGNVIANIDTIYSETLIVNIATYLLLYKNLNVRASFCAFLLPIYMYLSTIHTSFVEHIRYTFVAVMGLIAIFKYVARLCYHKNIKPKKFGLLMLGAAINGIEIYAFEDLQERYSYNFFHSIHHLCAFISICLYFYGPLTENSPYYQNKQKLCNYFSRCKKHKKIKADDTPKLTFQPNNVEISNLNINTHKTRNKY